MKKTYQIPAAALHHLLSHDIIAISNFASGDGDLDFYDFNDRNK